MTDNKSAVIKIIILLVMILLAAIAFIAGTPATGNNAVNEGTNPTASSGEAATEELTVPQYESTNEPKTPTENVTVGEESKPNSTQPTTEVPKAGENGLPIN